MQFASIPFTYSIDIKILTSSRLYYVPDFQFKQVVAVLILNVCLSVLKNDRLEDISSSVTTTRFNHYRHVQVASIWPVSVADTETD